MSQARKVLVVTREDVGGLSTALATECRRKGLADVRVLSLQPTPRWDFPLDLHDLHDGGQEFEYLTKVADVLHFIDVDPHDIGLIKLLEERKTLGLPQPRVVLQLDGRIGDAKALALATREAQKGHRVFATRPGLAQRAGVDFVMPFVPWWLPRYSPLVADTRMRESLQRPIALFISSRAPLERRPQLEAMLDRAEQVQHSRMVLEVLVNLPHRLILRRRRFAHLCLSQSCDGLALSALEALAQGVRVVASLSPQHAGAYAAWAGSAPPLIEPSELESLVQSLSPRTAPLVEATQWARAALDPSRWLLRLSDLWQAPASVLAASA